MPIPHLGSIVEASDAGVLRTPRATRKEGSPDGTSGGSRSGHDQFGRRGTRGWGAGRGSQRGGVTHDPVGGRVLQDRRDPRRRGREATGHHEPGSDDPLGQTAHGGQGLVRRRGREGVDTSGDLGADPEQAQAGRGGLPGRHRHAGRDHGPRLLRRRAAPGHQGSRADRRPRGPADHQRADGRCARLRAGQAADRADDPRVRPRRRNVRRLPPRDRRRRGGSQGHPRRHAARR